LSLLLTFFQALPEIISLLRAIQAGINEVDTNRKVKDDIKSIHQALTTKDASKLDHLFANEPDTSSVPVPAKKD